jgi:hypothetical protein
VTDDESPVVLEFVVPAAAFVLGDALRSHPGVTVEFELLVPTDASPLPYLWATGGPPPSFEDALEDDPQVDRVLWKTSFEDGDLYRVACSSDDGGLLDWISDAETDVALLQAIGRDDEWRIRLRFPSRARVAAFRGFDEPPGLDVRVVRLFELTEPKMGQYDTSEKQREALVRALEMGFFRIPREASLEDVAETLDISPRAVSERLRRGHANLIGNTLSVGPPYGVESADRQEDGSI